LREADGAELFAVGSRDLQRAKAFAADFGATHAYGSYRELADDARVDAIYIGTPHSEHEPHTLMCLQAGKHVLCEKPLALSAVQAERMIRMAQAKGLVLMEAVWTRFLPAITRVRELIAEGALGEVRMIAADFGFRADFDPASRLFAPELGGGALLDLGVYPVNLAVMLCGEPVEILTTANLGATGVDVESAILLRHAAGQLSLLSCSLEVDTPREAHIIGAAGRITIGFPWWAASRFVWHERDGAQEEFTFTNRGGGYTYEAEAFMDLIRSGRRDSDVMPLAESLAVLRTLDAIRARWGLRYPTE
jgi:predicted dehydrogenase